MFSATPLLCIFHLSVGQEERRVAKQVLANYNISTDMSNEGFFDLTAEWGIFSIYFQILVVNSVFLLTHNLTRSKIAFYQERPRDIWTGLDLSIRSRKNKEIRSKVIAAIELFLYETDNMDGTYLRWRAIYIYVMYSYPIGVYISSTFWPKYFFLAIFGLHAPGLSKDRIRH